MALDWRECPRHIELANIAYRVPGTEPAEPIISELLEAVLPGRYNCQNAIAGNNSALVA
jgi:hypothetical protein